MLTNHPRPSRVAALAGLALLAVVPALADAQMGAMRVVEGPSRVAAPAPAAPKPDPPVPSATGPTLHLANGGFVSGELVDSPDPGSIRWRSPAFAVPVDFAAGGIDAIRWPAPAKPPEPSGEYRFELAGGDVATGSLVALDATAAELDVPGLGRLHVDRSALHRLHRRRDGGGLVYAGPNGLAGWTPTGPKDAWREESGQPTTDREGATLRADLGLPARAVVEFEVSWKSKPDFILALGCGPGDAGPKQAFRFEVWDGTLVVGREVDAAADLAALGPVADGPGRAHLIAYLDQPSGRILVAAPDGRPLADLTIPDPPAANLAIPAMAGAIASALVAKAPAPGGVALVNVKGNVRLEMLRIGRWDGLPPLVVEAGRSRVHRVDGPIAYGEVTGYDAKAREFLLEDEEGDESRITADAVADVFLTAAAAGGPARPLRALYFDGTRLGGAPRRVEAGAVELAVPGVRGSLRLPIEGLRSLAFAPEAPPPPPAGRRGILELVGVKLPGSMADGRPGADPGGLAWLPAGGSAAPIRPGASGRIVYVEPKPPAPVAPATTIRRNNVAAAPRAFIAFNNAIDRLGAGTVAGQAKVQVDTRRSLHLRTGDVIPCEITAIDEAGVHYKADLSPGSFVTHAKIKAIELAPLAPDAIKVGKAKRERMLTLPRMQKDSPPTQLIRSVNGDYLRGRIVAMDAKTLQVEVRLETKAVPRDRVARIIWFHADELDPAKAAAAVLVGPEEAGPIRVQAVKGDGIRLTFRPTAQADGTLSGLSEVLGACQVRLADVDQLLIGPAIEKAAAQLAYGRWTLHNAEEPKFARADAAGGAGAGAAGSESPLVGKPAPDFELELLDGKKFHLAESKGQVVVLDFWATWCGPCIQAMPQVERVTKEFADRGVRLVAVNLQEAPRDIKAMLERHKLDVAVALDRDGVVADKYAATAIPQTVVVDRDGNVSRLFVGGGPGLEAQLRDALTGALGDAPKK